MKFIRLATACSLVCLCVWAPTARAAEPQAEANK